MLLTGYLILAAAVLSAQDASSSHFYANPLYMNPALAGIEGKGRAVLAYRNQWPSATDAYNTLHASYDQYVEALGGGVGMHVMNDQQGGGVMNNLSVDALYSYHLKVSRELTVSGGLQASVGQRNLNTEGLILPGDLDGGTGSNLVSSSRWYPDFSTGFAFFRKNLYGGVAVHHLLQPYMAQSKDPNTRLMRRYSANLGMLIPVYEKRFGKEVLQLSPNLIFLQQGIYQQLNYGMEIHYKDILGGLWFRQDLVFNYGTLIFSVGYARDQFRFRYSYDTRLSSPGLSLPHMGAHELSVGFVFENLHNSGKHRAIKSPKI